MSIPLNDQDSRQSALKDGIVIGILASLREFGIEINKKNVRQVLINQQGWTYTDIQYFIKFFGVN